MPPGHDPLPSTGPSDLDDVLARLRARVEERRRAGLLPVALEEDLDEHYRRVRANRAQSGAANVIAAVERTRQAARFGLDRISTVSSLPGGVRLHRGIAKVMARQLEGVLWQVREFADAAVGALESVVDAFEQGGGGRSVMLGATVDALQERVARLERRPGDVASELRVLDRRLAALEEGGRFDFRPWYSNDRFEERFRGTKEQLARKYRGLAERFLGHAPVLDVGCGRGEFLELLREAGVEARGIEIDAALVAQTRERGLDVVVGDAIDVLDQLEDGELGGLSLIQVIEHLAPQEALTVVALAARKVRTGGLVVIETVNPRSLFTFNHAFYLDPTHLRPVHPDYLEFLFREVGFEDVHTEFRELPGLDEMLGHISSGPDELRTQINEIVDRLNRQLFAEQDYALIATR